MAVIDQFIEILKKKGTGKTMSKHMNSDDITFIFFSSPIVGYSNGHEIHVTNRMDNARRQ